MFTSNVFQDFVVNFFRIWTAERLANFKIFVGNISNPDSFEKNSLCQYQVEALGAGERRIFWCYPEIWGQYVIVQIQASGTLCMCEVDVNEEPG